MAQMIPPFYEDSISSAGEKHFFHQLECLGDEYTVLHSLGLAHHRDKVIGEVDFVIICREGILCLEVKGGHVAREQGVWRFTNRFGQENKRTEGPFKQALGGMLSLRDNLHKHFGKNHEIVNAQYACGAVFPDMPFNQKGPEIIPEIVFDVRKPLDGVEAYIKEAFAYWRNRLLKTHGFQGGPLLPGQIAQLVQYLRGDFGFVPSLGYTVDHIRGELLALTEEQAQRLAIAGENLHIILRGGAGTGKTLLSLEYAQRVASSGKRVLFLCYNKNLALVLQERLSSFAEPTKENMTICHFHDLIYKHLEVNASVPAQEIDRDDYFSAVLPEAFVSLCEYLGFTRPYDVLVVDEGQDLLRYEYLMCFDKLLAGGLKSGRWHICYDPNQNIYNPQLDDGLDLLSAYNPTILALDTNCRNTKPIGVATTEFTGMPGERYLHVTGNDVTWVGYKDEPGQRRKITRVVKNLLGQGVAPRDIYLLSRYTLSKSCLKDGHGFDGLVSFQDISAYNPVTVADNTIRYSTIHSFKGLEAPVVLLLDVEDLDAPYSKHLYYTGMTRANSLLYVFCNEKIMGTGGSKLISGIVGG